MKKILVVLAISIMSFHTQAVLLTDLLNGQTIRAGDKLFDEWSILNIDSSDSRTINTDNIIVTALNDGGLDPGPGLQFEVLNDEFLVEGDDIYAYFDFMFGFRTTVLDPNFRVKDNSLYLTNKELQSPSTLASVFIEEIIYKDDSFNETLGIKDVEFSSIAGVVTDKDFDAAVFSPLSSIYVTKNILLEAVSIGESANLMGFQQRFSQVQVPSPTVLWLLGLSTVVLLVQGKRRVNHRC